MRLSLRLPEPWVRKFAPDEKIAAILPGDGVPRAVITYGPMPVVPDEPRAWQSQTIHSDLPPNSHVVVARTVDVKTATGWPLRLIEAEVRTKENELIELRLCGFYSFLEHVAAAIARTQNRAQLAALGDGLLDIFGSGRPDWRTDEVASLADVWDLEPAPRHGATRTRSVGDGVRRGNELLVEGRLTEARAELESAIERDATATNAHFLLGATLGSLGEHERASAAWTRAIELDPGNVDALYNRGQARFRARDVAGALEDFENAARLDPDDVMMKRKVIQCLYALDRHVEGEAARASFRALVASSRDPRLQRVHEYVFDQVAADGFTMFVTETLRPRNPSMPTLLAMSAVATRDNEEVSLPAMVLVETSEMARSSGTPFVVCVKDATKTRVVATWKELPPYVELREMALSQLRSLLNL